MSELDTVRRRVLSHLKGVAARQDSLRLGDFERARERLAAAEPSAAVLFDLIAAEAVTAWAELAAADPYALALFADGQAAFLVDAAGVSLLKPAAPNETAFGPGSARL